MQLVTMPISSDAKKLPVGRHCGGHPVPLRISHETRSLGPDSYGQRTVNACASTTQHRDLAKNESCVSDIDPVTTHNPKETQHKRSGSAFYIVV